MTRSGFTRDAAYSVFEAFRPIPGQTIDRVAAATYSLDLVAVAALLLSLSKAGEQELEAGPLSFIDALEQLAPRVDIVHQKDRLRAAENHYGILHVLDRRLHAVQPPRRTSYHPKLVLARYLVPSSKVIWRLWLGSRNLTGGQDREAGLLLIGHVGRRRSARAQEIAAMAADLLAPVTWVREHEEELAQTRWYAPEGVRLRGLHWRRAGEQKPFKTALRGCDRTLAISPFADADGCNAVFTGCADNRLLTSRPTAAALGTNVDAAISVADSPLLLSPMDVEPPGPAPAAEAPEVPDPPGLHAKLLLRQRGARARLWIGSANLTRRGMCGPNAEVLVELDVPQPVADDLNDFFDRHPQLGEQGIDSAEEARRSAERALDEAAAAVLEARFTLSCSEHGLHLSTEDPLDEFLVNHHLEAWLLTRSDTPARWPEGARSVLLVPGGVPLKLETVLVCFSAERRAGDCSPRQWAQAVAFPGHDPDARDKAASAAYIGVAGASAWLRAQLQGVLPVEPVTWTGARRWAGSEHAGNGEALPLALEEVLAAWARNPDEFEARAQGLEPMLKALGEELRRADDVEPDCEALAQWAEVERFWETIRATIGADNDA